MNKNLTLLALAIVSIMGNSIAMQREESIITETPKEYAEKNKLELIREYLRARNINPNMADITVVDRTTLYLWAAAKMDTPAAKEWYKNYLLENPYQPKPIFNAKQAALYEWARPF